MAKTNIEVKRYRDEHRHPKRMSFRFLAMLRKIELNTLALYYDTRINRFPEKLLNHPPGYYRNRHERIQSERRQRGYI